jgi:hypothetical protein
MMKITERMIDGEIYNILSIGRFASASDGKLSDEVRNYLKDKVLKAKWNTHAQFGLFLESVKEFQSQAEVLFKTKNVGVLVFVNDSEPDTPLDQITVKKGDIIEIAYTGKGPEATHQNKYRQKQSFFESSDKKQYSSPYRRESEWRRPKGA